MEPSDEIHEAMLEMVRCSMGGDASPWIALWSQRPHVHSVGSDPREWYVDHDEIATRADATYKVRGDAEFVVKRVLAFQEGSVGWGIAEVQPEWKGRWLQQPFRLSAVFHLERGQWKMVQSHRSFAIKDDDLWGFNLTEILDGLTDQVQRERPSMTRVAAPNGTVTILFTDIEGSTRLTHELGDRAWFDLLRRHNEIVRHHTAAHSGFEVKSQGDGFMLAFSSAVDALGCAASIQRAFENERVADEPLRIRIGVHTGEAIKQEDDFFGTTVNFAARVAGEARGGEILVSSLVRDLVGSTRSFAFDGPTQAELKGFPGVHGLYSLAWRDHG